MLTGTATTAELQSPDVPQPLDRQPQPATTCLETEDINSRPQTQATFA